MRTLILALLLTLPGVMYSQKNDYTWLLGYASEAGYDPNSHWWFGISKFEFANQSLTLSYDSLGFNVRGTNATVSNANGQLRFYTNGVTIRNYNDEVIGDSLNNGFYLNVIPLWHYLGNPHFGITAVIPHPTAEETYDIFYGFVDTSLNSSLTISKMARAQVDMSSNFGNGSLNYKDVQVLGKELTFGLNAVKHGNGRDWWIISKNQGSNCYNMLLYNGGVNLVQLPEQCAGAIATEEAETTVLRFSSDGTHLLSTGVSQLDFFDVNRCTGTLTLIESVPVSEIIDSADYDIWAAEFSPNGRYVYVCCSKEIFQYDLLATPIASSKMSIAKYIPYNSSPAPLLYNYAQLGPDGKIYVTSLNTTYFTAVINAPDQSGSACGFQDTVRLPSFTTGLPYYPGYRLGAMQGSPCDSLTGVDEETETGKERLIKIHPNPAIDYLVVDYGNTDWNKGDVVLEVVNAIGQIQYEKLLPKYSGLHKLAVKDFPSGLYTVYVKRNELVVAVSKFIKE